MSYQIDRSIPQPSFTIGGKTDLVAGEKVLHDQGFDIHVLTSVQGEVLVTLRRQGEAIHQFCCELIGPGFFDSDIPNNEGVVSFGIVARKGTFWIGVEPDSY